MLDIILNPHNSVIHQALNALDRRSQPAVRCNNLKNKRQEVRSSFTAPNTKSILR
ncbi:hypothetical protein AHAS_Ahas02G0067000 [Arachis hypogaea]